MPESVLSPIPIAAIDAGSNAIRLVIAQVASTTEIHKVDNRRIPVRLGHRVFTNKRFDSNTLSEALEVFKHFRSLMDRYRVESYRAVATSACREAKNSDALVNSIYEETGIRLEIIDAKEEARLINQAVIEAVGKELSPELVIDLGGGSLEISLITDGIVANSFSLPIGTVRMMERLKIKGALSKKQFAAVRGHVRKKLKRHLPGRPDLLGAGSAACGGNAEALALLAPGPLRGKIPTIDVYFLEEILWRILRKGLQKRMKAYQVGRDRAEVMGIAAIIFATLGQWLGLGELLVPGVGVREGVLRDLMAQHFGRTEVDEESRIRAILGAARHTALRFGCEQRHSDKVRDLALSLFDQLNEVHQFGTEERLLLELGSMLHDIGHIVGGRGHHKHGEYLVSRHRFPGLSGQQKKIVACLVRYHTKRMPQATDEVYASLPKEAQSLVRRLAAILRIAERLDVDHQLGVRGTHVTTDDKSAIIHVRGTLPSVHAITETEQKADLFEQEFGLEVHVKI